MSREQSKRILVAGIWTSSAVLTKTVCALAYQRVLVVPDEIVVFIGIAE